MNVLGISALYHDSAAALVKDGEIIAAAQEERFTRKKHDLHFPKNAVSYCLKEGRINEDEIDIVVFYDDPLLSLDRFMKNVLCDGADSLDIFREGSKGMFSDRLWVNFLIEKYLWKGTKPPRVDIVTCRHHMSHAASAFFPSPFKEAVILTMDGVGEWASTTVGYGNEKKIQLFEEIRYPHSLGLLYSAFTYFCGFRVNSGDYKFMGLAPYGRPVYESVIREKMIDIKYDGSFRLNLDYFDYHHGRTMINDNFSKLFGGPRRQPESRITQREMDIAASAQRVVEDVILRLVMHCKKQYGAGTDNLVMAGGVALNCVANGKIQRSGIFKNIWIQPAAGDAGGSLGAALCAAYEYDEKAERKPDTDLQKGSYLGPSFSMEEIEQSLKCMDAKYHVLNNDVLFNELSKELDNQKIVGLFHGRMEFGPRALGNRSIIADPRSELMQVKLNRSIKFRESFRPFAPSVLLERVGDYFETDTESPYMLLVSDVKKERRVFCDVGRELEESGHDMLSVVKKKRSDIPAVTHVDYSARIQTVSEDTNEFYYKLIRAFEKRTGCGVIVNTSFNVRGEPIVCTPEDAYRCFMRTDMDILVLENAVLYKNEQPEWTEDERWKEVLQTD